MGKYIVHYRDHEAKRRDTMSVTANTGQHAKTQFLDYVASNKRNWEFLRVKKG